MEGQRVQQLLKKFENYAAGYYFDCTRSNVAELVKNICITTQETHDYDKFVTAIANVLFKKIYIEEEVWKAGMISGLIDIVLEILDVKEEKTDFIPANAMLGEKKDNTSDLRSRIIEQFNKNVTSSEFEEIHDYTIGV